MNTKTLDSLRRLAERPGTEAEGIVAREMLAKLEAKIILEPEENPLLQYLETNDLDGFMDAIRRTGGRWRTKCDCGAPHWNDEKCADTPRHEAIRAEILAKFPIGTEIYYNQWAYEMNSYGMVAGYVRPGLHNWAWIRLKLAHLKNVRAVPIYSAKGWHLSTEPVSRNEWERLYFQNEKQAAMWYAGRSEWSV